MLSSDARRLLQALAAQPGQHIAAAATADLTGHTTAHAAELLDELVLANLLRDGPAGFTINGLLRLYLRSLTPGGRTAPGQSRRDSCERGHNRSHWRARTPCA
jgi:hypothetical protein